MLIPQDGLQIIFKASFYACLTIPVDSEMIRSYYILDKLVMRQLQRMYIFFQTTIHYIIICLSLKENKKSDMHTLNQIFLFF